MTLFQKKALVTLEMVQAALSGSRDSDELNPIFFDGIGGKEDKLKKRSSVSEFFQAFGLLKESQIGDLISQSSQQEEEEETIEQILQDEELEYYLNDDLLEKDFILKEFAKLSTRAGHYETNQELKKLEKINRIIEKRLNNNCIKHYGNIAKGLKNMENLGDDNIVSLVKIQVIRNILRAMKDQVTKNSIRVVQLKKQSANVKSAYLKIQEIYNIVGSRFKILSEIQVQQQEFQFLKCNQIYRILRETKEIVNQHKNNTFQEINAFKNLEVVITQKQKNIIDIVIKNWSLLHRKYEENQFFNNLLSQFILERKNEIEQLETLKNKQLIEISDEIIQEAVKEFVSLESYDKDNMTFNLNYISKEQFLPFLQKIYSSFSKLMINYHYISRWLVKNDSNESVQILTTDWSQNLLDDESLSPQQQLDIFLEYVQKKKNIYLQERKMLWQTIEHKVRQIINNTYQINGFSEGELITFLKFTSDFIGTGIQYSNSESENIRQCVNQKIVTYYQFFIINFQKSIQSALSDEKWEQVDEINYLQLQTDLYTIINTPLKPEFINSIQYILPELKVENIETYSPQNNAKYMFSTPNIRTASMSRIEGEISNSQGTSNQFTSPDYSPSIDHIKSDITLSKMTEIKLEKCDSQTPIRTISNKYEAIIQEDSKFISKIKFISASTLRMIIGIMNSLRLIKILQPVQLQIYEAMMEIIDYYIYSMHYQLNEKSFKEKLIKKFVLEHMNANNENLIEIHENKMDFLMDQHALHKKYFNSRAYFAEQYCKFGDDSFTLPQNQINGNNEEKSKKQFEVFEGLSFQLPTFNHQETANQQLTSRIIAAESFLSLLQVLDKIKPFLTTFLKRNADLVTERFKVYGEIKQEFIEAIYSSFLPVYTKNQIGSESIINNVKWDVKDISRDIKPNSYVQNFKVFLQKQHETIDKIFTMDEYLEQKKYLYQLIVDNLFKAAVDTYTKLKSVSLQSRAQLLADIKQILAELDELLIWETKAYKTYLEKYLDMLQFCNADDIHTFIVKYREIYPFRAFRSLFFLSEIGVVLKKKQKQDNQIQMLKNYQIFFRDLK